MIMDGISVEEFAEIRAEERAEEAYAKGEQAGAAQEKKALAKAMQAKGLSPDLIKEITGLSPKDYQ